MNFSVLVATFGDQTTWWGMAQNAMDSAYRQTMPALEVLYQHGDTLAGARNQAAARAKGDYLIFLDADDTIDEDYIAAMWEAAVTGDDIYQPSTLGIVDGRRDHEPVLIPEKPLIDGNYIVIGAAVHRETFLRAGGFIELPLYEDWELWLRLVCGGARVGKAPAAIYEVNVRPNSRNNQDRSIQLSAYSTIRAMHEPAYRKRWGYVA